MLKIIEKIMFNLYYSNHLLQLIGHNPMNSNSIINHIKIVISLTQIQLEYYNKLFTSSLRMFCGIFRERKGPRYRRFFCRTSFMKHFQFYTNLKFNLENLIFHICPNVALILKNVFIFKDRTLKKNN